MASIWDVDDCALVKKGCGVGGLAFCGSAERRVLGRFLWIDYLNWSMLVLGSMIDCILAISRDGDVSGVLSWWKPWSWCILFFRSCRCSSIYPLVHEFIFALDTGAVGWQRSSDQVNRRETRVKLG